MECFVISTLPPVESGVAEDINVIVPSFCVTKPSFVYICLMVRKYTDKELLDRVKSLQSFKSIPEGYWLLGVRSSEDTPNQFDDKFYFFKGEEFILVTSGTTNPGVPILQGGFKRYNKMGAAVVVADHWYYKVWRKGKHLNRTTALLQLGAKIKVHRDGDMDTKSEATENIVEGYFGINFHPNTFKFDAKTTASTIGLWSAGCQVVNDMEKYRSILNQIPSGVGISYCLLNEF